MSEHLPECPVWRCCKPDERATMHMCICSHLRACTERVISEGDEQSQIAYTTGYRHALDTLRKEHA